jgi:biotin transport system substrate-specific component
MTTAAAPLGFTLIRGTGRHATLTLVVAGAVFVALAAQITVPLPFTPVPVTGQTFGVLLVGASLGTLAGAASLTLYVLAGAIGAPVYADHSSGLDVLRSPTGGYLIGFIAAAALTGFLAQKRWDRVLSSAIGAMLCGNVIIYACGLPWLAHVLHTNLDKTLEYGFYPFIIGDTLKLYLAAALLPATWRIASERRVRKAASRAAAHTIADRGDTTEASQPPRHEADETTDEPG